jgi:hypothetical protein|nr:MAG TPA: hypothetical protein [Caudoviricetes sp.]
MKTYKFFNSDKSIDCEVITDAMGKQEQFTVTEWPPRGWNAAIAALMPDWSVTSRTQNEFIQFATKNSLGLVAVENDKEPVELVAIS